LNQTVLSIESSILSQGKTGTVMGLVWTYTWQTMHRLKGPTYTLPTVSRRPLFVFME